VISKLRKYKKLTREQRKWVEKKKLDTYSFYAISETNKELKIYNPTTKEIVIIDKEGE